MGYLKHKQNLIENQYSLVVKLYSEKKYTSFDKKDKGTWNLPLYRAT